MSYEAIVYDQAGRALQDIRAEFDRGWALNGREQCTFSISTVGANMDNFRFGNYLVITDAELPVWGGYFAAPQTWGTSERATVQAYSGEGIFSWRCYRGEKLLKGTAGAIYRQIVENLNTSAPLATLMRPGEIYDGGASREETVTARSYYDDVLRISARSGNDWWVEPVTDDGALHFEAHWYSRRGETKRYALEEGVNIEASDNVMEYQGEIYNYIFAFGNGATWADRVTLTELDQTSIDLYGLRMYALSVNAGTETTVRASAQAFLRANAYPQRVFSLVVGGKRTRENAAGALFATLRVGDVVDLLTSSIGGGLETKVRVLGITHRGKSNTMNLVVKEMI